MSLAAYLKLTSTGDPRWAEVPDYEDDLPVGDITDELEDDDYLCYGDHADLWHDAGHRDPGDGTADDDPSYWQHVHDGSGGLNLTQVEGFTRAVLRRVETSSPPGYLPAPGDMTCVLSATGGDWGVYGAGVLDPQALNPDGHLIEEDLGPNRVELLLDPAWLDHDFRNLHSRQPWLNAQEAEWAVEHLRTVLDISIPPTAVLRASLPPIAYGPASGNPVYWPAVAGAVKPEEGTLGPGVSYHDRSGNPVEGFITAGHVAQPKAPSQVQLRDSTGAIITAHVDRSRLPGGLGTQLGRYLNGAVDGALVSSGGSPVKGLGRAGAAGPRCATARVGGSSSAQGSSRSGQVVGYAKWLATGPGAWGNCYTVAGSNPAAAAGSKLAAFAAAGDSGAAVLAGKAVIGIVVGGAAAVPGCPAVLTYVQDIARLRRALRCRPIP